MDRDGLADFLRRRRATLQPGDVGMAVGPRRRATGLRREEVASLAGMSTDYYARLEQRRGPRPSVLLTQDQAQTLLVLTAPPGTAGYDQLQVLSTVGTERFGTAPSGA